MPNNELLDFLSRVPDDEEIVDYRELKLMSNQEESSPQKGKSAGMYDIIFIFGEL